MEFPVLQLSELIAGKVKAMMERLAARDLFDLYRLSSRQAHALEDPLCRALVIRAISTSNPFPFVVDPVEALLRHRQPPSGFVEPLEAMLRPEDVVPYDEMIDTVGRWLSPLTRLSRSEKEYVDRLQAHSEYAPELLLSDWPDTLDRARRDPVMAWKVQNLMRRPEVG